jgi:hypothetical protein
LGEPPRRFVASPLASRRRAIRYISFATSWLAGFASIPLAAALRAALPLFYPLQKILYS